MTRFGRFTHMQRAKPKPVAANAIFPWEAANLDVALHVISPKRTQRRSVIAEERCQCAARIVHVWRNTSKSKIRAIQKFSSASQNVFLRIAIYNRRSTS